MQTLADKKILITGGSGHLGSALIHYLVGSRGIKPHNIRVFYLKGSPLNSLADIEGLDFFAGNVLTAADVEAACKGVHLVFHMIGLTTFDPRQKRLQWQVNVHGTRNVLEAIRKSPTVERLCYTSTVNALAPPWPQGTIGNFDNSNPYNTNLRHHTFASRQATLSFIERTYTTTGWEKEIGICYYDSKLAAHELVDEYVHQHGINAVSVLPGTMFGPYDYLIGTGMYLLSIYKNQMPVVLNGGMPLAHVMDVAEGHVLAMEKAQRGSQYILSGPDSDNRSFKDMCGIIAAVLQNRFSDKTIRKPQLVVPAGIAMAAAFFAEKQATLFNQPMLLSRDAVKAGAAFLYYTSANATRDLGYQPKRTFKQAVEEMLEYYIQHNLLQAAGRYVDLKPNRE